MKHKNPVKTPFPFPLLLWYETSKPLPIPASTHLEWEGVLTFWNCMKYREIGFWKPFLFKICRNWPLNGLQSMPDGWEVPDPQIPCPIGNHFSWRLGYFARQTKLKWTKNLSPISQLDQKQQEGVLTFRCRHRSWSNRSLLHTFFHI